MDAFIKYSELKKGDIFLIDTYTSNDKDHSVGMVLEDVKPGAGTPCVVTIHYREIVVDQRKKPRKFELWRNAQHITKFIRPGEYDPRLNMGRG